MSTYTKNLMAENGWMVGMEFGRGYTGRAYAVTAAKGEAGMGIRVKNIALFFAAPFIGLAYLLAFPVVGFALLLWVVARAAMKNEKVRPLVLALAAPFIGLAFLTVGPIAGLVALTWIGGTALLKT